MKILSQVWFRKCLSYHLAWIYRLRALKAFPPVPRMFPPHSGCSSYQDSSPQGLRIAQTYVLAAILHNSGFKLKRWKWKDLNKGSRSISVRRDVRHYWVRDDTGCLRLHANQCCVQAATIGWFGLRRGVRNVGAYATHLPPCRKAGMLYGWREGRI